MKKCDSPQMEKWSMKRNVSTFKLEQNRLLNEVVIILHKTMAFKEKKGASLIKVSCKLETMILFVMDQRDV